MIATSPPPYQIYINICVYPRLSAFICVLKKPKTQVENPKQTKVRSHTIEVNLADETQRLPRYLTS